MVHVRATAEDAKTLNRTLFATALTPLFWGSTYAVTVLALPPDRPFFTAAARALPAGLLLLFASPVWPRGGWWGRLVLLATLNVAAVFSLIFVAAYRLPGGIASLLGAIQPLAVALLAYGILGERLRKRVVAASLAGMAGVALLVLRSTAHLDAIGIAAATAATLCAAVGIILTKHWGRPMPLVPFVGWQLVIGGTILVAIMSAVEGAPPHLTALNFAGFAWLIGFGTLIAYVLWFRGIERLGPTPVALIGLLSPLTATTLGVVLLGERYTMLQLLGGALILGALLALYRGPVSAGVAPSLAQ